MSAGSQGRVLRLVRGSSDPERGVFAGAVCSARSGRILPHAGPKRQALKRRSPIAGAGGCRSVCVGPPRLEPCPPCARPRRSTAATTGTDGRNRSGGTPFSFKYKVEPENLFVLSIVTLLSAKPGSFICSLRICMRSSHGLYRDRATSRRRGGVSARRCRSSSLVFVTPRYGCSLASLKRISRLLTTPAQINIVPNAAMHSRVRDGSCVTSAVPVTVRNCTGDEGRPFEVGNQVLISSHRKLLSSKAMAAAIAIAPLVRKRVGRAQLAARRE